MSCDVRMVSCDVVFFLPPPPPKKNYPKKTNKIATHLRVALGSDLLGVRHSLEGEGVGDALPGVGFQDGLLR